MMREHLTTDRLVLRPPAVEDAAAITALISNWNVISKLSAPPFPYALEDAIAYLKGLPSDVEATGLRVYAITRSEELLGTIGISVAERGPQLGYWLGEPYWGRGIITEGGRAVIDAYFNATTEDALASGYFVDNAASATVLKKLGFKLTGEGEMLCRPRGVHMRHIDMQLSRTRWREAAQ